MSSEGITARIVAADGPILYAQVELPADAYVSKTAYDFARGLDTGFTDVAVVSTFVTRKGDPDFPVGVWVLGLEVSPAMRERVEAGKVSTLSLSMKVAKHARPTTVNAEAVGELRRAMSGHVRALGFGRFLR